MLCQSDCDDEEDLDDSIVEETPVSAVEKPVSELEVTAIPVDASTGIEKIEMVFNSDKVRGKDQFKQIEKNQIKTDLKNAGINKDDI